MSEQQIDKFTYSLELPPLHLVPLNEKTRDHTLSISDYIATSATRRFFGMLEKYRSEKKLHLITQNKVLDSGEVVGEFCMCYIQTLHQRRQTKSSSSGLLEEDVEVKSRKRMSNRTESLPRKRRRTKDDGGRKMNVIDSAPNKRR